MKKTKKKVSKKKIIKKPLGRGVASLLLDFNIVSGVSPAILDFLTDVNDLVYHESIDDVFFRNIIKRSFNTLKVRAAKEIFKGSDSAKKSLGYEEILSGELIEPDWIKSEK